MAGATIPPSRHILILGQRFSICITGELGDEELGRCETSRQIIHINERQGNDSIRDTLLHEILHAIHYLLGCDDGTTEERFTSAGATGLRAVMLDNPLLMAWVFAR